MSDEVELPVRVTIGEFDDRAVQRVSSALDKCVAVEQQFLPIQIMSPGGDVYAMFAIIDLIQHGPVPCATIAVGMAMSAGSVLLASGHKGLRFVGPNATVMVHEMMGGVPISPIADLKGEVGLATNLNSRMLAHLDKMSGKRAGYWRARLRKMESRDLNMTAQEAVAAGLADHVGLPIVRLEQQQAVTLTLPETVEEQKKPAPKKKAAKR